MAEAKECDRCGSLYKCQCDIPIISIIVYYPTTGGKEIDLCPECKKAILEWIKKPADQDDDEDKRLPRIGRWVFWGGWVSNHDLRIDDAVCSECGYQHPMVRWEAGDPTGAKVMAAVLGKLAKECPGCGAKMIGGDEDGKE